MMKKHDHHSMGHSDKGWLQSLFHFSFADYFSEHNIRFGVLRVLNDDLVAAGGGFPLHFHSNMEIISYVVTGELTHADSLGNEHTLRRGDVQYMSAGSGIRHSEYNRSGEALRFIQIWILPERKDLAPAYGDHRFPGQARLNQWLAVASGQEGSAPVRLHQDASILVSELEAGRSLALKVPAGRQVYLVQIEGRSSVNDALLDTRDALSIVEEDIVIQAETKSHLLAVDMARFDEYDYV